MGEDTLDSRTASLEANQNNLLTVFKRLDHTIEKLTEVSAGVSKMLAVHENRLDNQDKIIEILMAKADKDIQRVAKEVERVEKNNANNYTSIMKELETHRAESKAANGEIKTRIGKLEKYIWFGMGILGTMTFLVPIVLRFFV